MLQRDALIQDIRSGLAALQNYVRPGGTLNLTDTNVHAENLVATLLNGIYGWDLVSTNCKSANYPCIDLIDEGRWLGVQVTSEKGSVKLTKTIECLARHGLASKIRQLKVFSLISKQKQYTVNVECPGVEFDWRNDVVDFDNVLQAAQAIADLQHLQQVHRLVVAAIPSMFPQHRERLPPLHVPVTDPDAAWLAFSSRATKLIGRDAERSQLTEFLNSPANFSWWLVTGVAGSGKSRLALELCRQTDAGWHAGFLSRTERDFRWSEFRPLRSTLIVVDYVASRATEVSEIILTLSRASSTFTKPVRVLLLERDKGSWWTTYSRDESQSESAEIAACRYGEPLNLSWLTLEATLQLAEEVVHSRNGTWNPTIAREFLARLLHYDRGGRPLFAMIVARYLESIGSDAPNSSLLQVVLKKEAGRRRQLINQPDDLQRIENLLHLATLVGGLLPKANGFGYLASSDVANLIPDVGILNESLYNDIAGSARGGASVAGLQPDILGERFVLDRLSEPGLAGLNAKRLLLAAWSLQPKDLRVVSVRCAFDFSEDPALYELFDLTLETAEARQVFADMVADLMGVAADCDAPFAQHQLRKVVAIADSRPQEHELQEAVARADYNSARKFMFLDNRLAIERLDAAISRASEKTLIGKMALHNRAILYRLTNENFDAFEVFTMMIETHDATDEMRACAFNNRADVYAERGDHENAIRDRTAVLSLKATSHDRRFIALLRRGWSFSARGNDRAALDDLAQILETWDITPEQKADARLERAMIWRNLEKFDEARADLDAVIRSSFLFSGTRARALVELAEVSRRTGDHALAERSLETALKDPDVEQSTAIDAGIVSALLLEDTGNLDDAREMWRTVLSAPRASTGQVRTAQGHLDAMPPADP
jgi:tetratricopeptide (TPR) repeat protein